MSRDPTKPVLIYFDLGFAILTEVWFAQHVASLTLTPVSWSLERTMMSWPRTAAALIGFGFTSGSPRQGAARRRIGLNLP